MLLSIDGGRAHTFLNIEPSVRQPPSYSRNLSKIHPSKTLPKPKTEGRRWRYLGQRSRDDPTVDTGPDPWDPIDCEEIYECCEKEPVLVIQNEFGITTIPLRNTETISKDIVELHNIGTQTESLAAHGLQKAQEVLSTRAL